MIATVTLNPSLDEWVILPALRVGTLNRATGFARYPGGKGINVSRVVAELGERTVAFAPIGGEDGVTFRKLMTRLAIPHHFLHIPGTTRNNYKILTTAPRTLTELNTTGPRVSSRDVSRLLHRLLTYRLRPHCVTFCGSLPPGAPETLYAHWIRRLRAGRVLTVLDTSGEALRAGLRARPWLVKPNRQEAEALLGIRLTNGRRIRDAMEMMRRHGPDVVIVSLGKDGAFLAAKHQTGMWWAKPPAVTVQSSVGAGDSLVGGFLVGWFRTRILSEALRLGVAAGTAATMTPGTELCHRNDVRRLVSRVTLRRLA